MDSGRNTRALPRVGFPIRRSPDQRSVSTSPGLIAAAHVLLRLLAPRHPPCALVLLIEENPCVVAMEFSRCARDGARDRQTSRGTVSQNSTASETSRSTCFQASSNTGRRLQAAGIDGPSACRSKSSGIPRKEVIQPQLPLRLPCYDFTPIIDPTFDGSLPCGLGHRLRVLPTFVV
jgi:hypothetical protein